MKTVVMETRLKIVVLLSILPLKQYILGVRITNKTDIFKTFLSQKPTLYEEVVYQVSL